MYVKRRLFFNWIFHLFTFQMLSPFLVSFLQLPYPILPLPASIRVFPQPLTHSYLAALAFPYTRALSLHRTKGFSSHRCKTRPSSTTYAAGAVGPSMYNLWLVVYSLRALGCLIGWYCCSTYGVANPFNSFSHCPNLSTGVTMLSSMFGCTCICICIGTTLTGPLRGQLY